MLKKIFLALFVMGAFFSSSPYVEEVVHAASRTGNVAYMDERYIVIVNEVRRFSDEHLDTDVGVIHKSNNFIFDTHYEFQKVRGSWMYRTHREKYGDWDSVSSSDMAKGILNYAYYNR